MKWRVTQERRVSGLADGWGFGRYGHTVCVLSNFNSCLSSLDVGCSCFVLHGRACAAAAVCSFVSFEVDFMMSAV